MFDNLKDYIFVQKCDSDEVMFSYLDFVTENDYDTKELKVKMRKVKVKKTLGITLTDEEKELSEMAMPKEEEEETLSSGLPYASVISPKYITRKVKLNKKLIPNMGSLEDVKSQLEKKIENEVVDLLYSISKMDRREFGISRPNNREDVQTVSRRIISSIQMMSGKIATEGRVGPAHFVILGYELYELLHESGYIENDILGNLKILKSDRVDSMTGIIYRVQTDLSHIAKSPLFLYREDVENNQIKYRLDHSILKSLCRNNIKGIKIEYI